MRTRQAEIAYRYPEPDQRTHFEYQRANGQALPFLAATMTAAIVAFMAASPAFGAEPRHTVSAGQSIWLCSNESDCELEASRMEGVAVIGSVEWPVTERAWWGVELQLSAHSVHGINQGGRDRSADGNTAFVAALHGNVGYDLPTVGAWTPFAFGGLGVMAATVQPVSHPWRDDGREIQGAAVGLSTQAGIGARYQVAETWGIVATARYVQPTEVSIDGADADFARVVSTAGVYW